MPADPHYTPTQATAALHLLQQAMVLANRAAITDIELHCVPVRMGDELRWYDTRAMVDPREHCNEVIDMAVEALSYAEAAGLICRHPEQRHLVCITAAGRVA